MNEIIDAIDALNLNKTLDTDKISHSMLKTCHKKIPNPFPLQIKKKSLEVEQYIHPTCWKIANNVVILKRETIHYHLTRGHCFL